MPSHRPRLTLTLLLAGAAGACGGYSANPSAGPAGAAAAAPAPGCAPLETRPPNAPDQRPAFAGQTRTCGVTSNVAFDVTVVARGLVHPWAVEPLPGGDLLVTERPGRMRVISASGTVGEPITGIPPVDSGGQGGLLDVALGPPRTG